MSKSRLPGLHIEWSPGQVQAINTATGQTASGTRLSDLGPLLSGHRDVLVGVGRNVVFLKAIRLPKALPEDLRRILSVQIGSLFPLPSDQLAFDFYQTADQTQDGFLTIIAAIRAQDFEQLRAELQQAGLKAARILPVALGAPGVAKHAGMTDALVVELGANGLTLDVVQEGTTRFSRVAMAGSDPRGEAQRTLAAANAGPLPLVTIGNFEIPGGVVSTGTALKYLEEAPTFAFERNEDRIKAEKQRVGTRTRFAGLMLLSAILLAGLVWVERSDAQTVVNNAEATWTRQQDKVRSIRETETVKAQAATTLESTMKRAFQPAQPLSDIAAVISDMLPPSVWLGGLSIERGKPLQIRGTATKSEDVTRFVNALGSDPRFRDVKLVFANSARIEETPVVQFSLTATAVGNLPMPAPDKKKAARAKAAKPAASTGTTGTTGTESAGTTAATPDTGGQK